MITLARSILIFLAVIGSPFYAAWIFGGWICDQRGQRRAYSLLKGPRGNAA